MNYIIQVKPPVDIPQELISLGDNIYNLSLSLSYLDDKLTILEETPLIAGQRIDYQAYSEARSFLKICYMLIRIAFDDVSGVIKYFYDINEPNSGVTKSFHDLLKSDKNKKLPEDLSAVLRQTITHFPKLKSRRDDLVHKYKSFLISFRQGEDDKPILGHFSTEKRTSTEYGDIRQYFGNILCEYQTLIDNLLEHFDIKFIDWYRFAPPRNITIMSERMALPLWWAYKYGNYKHKDLQVSETINK